MTHRPANDTLHMKIRGWLLDKILGGTWAPGHQIPIETELASQFGVSRMTVNKVMTQLSQEGYVVRHKRRGSFVAQPRSQSAVMEIASIRAEVAALGLAHGWQLMERALRPLTEDEDRLLNRMTPRADTPLLIVQGLHLAGETPFCHELRAINPAACPEALDQDFTALEPGQWLLETVPWISASHTVRAINAAPSEAALLAIPEGQACLEILRMTRHGSGWVTCARLAYSGQAHQIVAQFSAGGAG
ncbi:UTRA domain-containing protein [Pseudooceanicola sp. HF7]|uniref:UTRA domain-containing protein n=1 Tax=Pseudooceanicola sp. HF7 TaxID=2721560 RepID=UPI001430356E|nr:UTRA domain-containing protein [Pseudooceanicola sp. HF7]